MLPPALMAYREREEGGFLGAFSVGGCARVAALCTSFSLSLLGPPILVCGGRFGLVLPRHTLFVYPCTGRAARGGRRGALWCPGGRLDGQAGRPGASGYARRGLLRSLGERAGDGPGGAARRPSSVPDAAPRSGCLNAAVLLARDHSGGKGVGRGRAVAWPGGGVQGRRGAAARRSVVPNAGGPLAGRRQSTGCGGGGSGLRQGSAVPPPSIGPPDKFLAAPPTLYLREVASRVPCLRT